MIKKTERRHEPYFKFKSYLVEKDIKQADVAKMIKRSNVNFNQKLNGRGADFTGQELKEICTELNISCDKYFFAQ